MNDHFMQQRRDTQPDPSLFEMRLRAERAERERDRLLQLLAGVVYCADPQTLDEAMRLAEARAALEQTQET